VTFDLNGRAALLRRHVAEQLTAGGQLRSPAWRAAVEAVPRHELVPQFFRMLDGPGPSRWEPVTPERVGVDRWLELAYADDSLVTQLDGVGRPAEVDKPVVGAVPTSSSTMPSLVVRMWEDLRVDDDARVLEIGTGTGYSTALGCQRLGEDQVTSVEVDPELAGAARAALERAGHRPALVVGDGLRGYPARARYDRVIATCAVRTVPAAWMEQTRPGGLILVTVSGWLHGCGLALLKVTDGDTAEGRFLPGDVSFMPARAHTPLVCRYLSWIATARNARRRKAQRCSPTGRVGSSPSSPRPAPSASSSSATTASSPTFSSTSNTTRTPCSPRSPTAP
jgi:methyltransferase of ATP-grasp peptide maturase system